ncbi:MAG: hypothetical protein JKY65_22105 [Planctomycetes bacterium]|nr:hypothetical protein [Planctomycetota bacterium]
MGIKQDRPIDPLEEGVVVYVAKSKEEVLKARAALVEAGVPINLPEAAIEAMFAAGRTSLPIRVAAANFRAAGDVIDELFPPPVIDLPPLPGTEPAAASKGKSKGKDGGGVSANAASVAADGSGPGSIETYRPDVSAGPGQMRKLEASANKVLFIALASFVVPIVGIGTGIFAGFSAYWCIDRLPYESSARGRAKVALGLAVAAIVTQISAAAYLTYMNT